MTTLTQDQLVRKEVAVGVARDLPLDRNYIWNRFAPMMTVGADDITFQVAKPQNEGMVPARAEDAESELAQKDDYFSTGRASIVDWAVKDSYSSSDVTRHREFSRLAELAGGTSFPLTVGLEIGNFNAMVARDAIERRRKIERRLEWLTMNQALSTGAISYNDGKMIWTDSFGRPVNQHNQATPSGVNWDVGDGSHDPIGDFHAVVEFMEDTHDVTMASVILSRKAIRRMADSLKFYPRSGLATPAGAVSTDINYLISNFDPSVARSIVEQATGLNVIEYEAKWNSRPIGSTTNTRNRFVPENQAIFIVDMASAGELIGTEIGFGKTLTSPHAENGFQSGFYAWEQSGVDPWMTASRRTQCSRQWNSPTRCFSGKKYVPAWGLGSPGPHAADTNNEQGPITNG